MFSTKTALVIDDASSIRRYVAKLLQGQMGFADVIQESSAGGALNILKERKNIDIIICDWEMPTVSGFALLTQLKQHETWKDIPFIMATTRADKESIVMAIQAGVSEYIVKPFSGQALEAKLSTIFNPIARRGAERVTITQKTDVNVNFKGISYEGEFIDISEGGCQVKTDVFKNGGNIFDIGNIVFSDDGEKIVVRGKLVRLEGERETKKVRAAFIFEPMDYKVKKSLQKFIGRFKIAAPTEASWKEQTEH